MADYKKQFGAEENMQQKAGESKQQPRKQEAQSETEREQRGLRREESHKPKAEHLEKESKKAGNRQGN